MPTVTSVFPTIFNLTDLNGKNGFILNGIKAGDNSGYSVASAGDINSDGIADVIIGAYEASPNGKSSAGQSYVIFGRTGGWSAAMNLSSLNGSTGFVLNGIRADDHSGFSVASAGDFNGDGVSDVIIGAYLADPNGQFEAGQSYVVFGRSGVWPAVMNLSSLNGSMGFVLNGINAGGDHSGVSVAPAGDINDDGVNDVIIGAHLARGMAGQSYVVFGRSGAWPAVMNLSSLNGSNGFAINGIKTNDSSGRCVASAGDINGDGISDVIISAHHAGSNGQVNVGQSFVVFGRSGIWPATMNLNSLNGSTGFVLNGIKAGDANGWSVASAGDINGDGIGDIIIGAPIANNQVGQSYVVFGRFGMWPAVMNMSSLNGSTGFALNGIKAGDENGYQVASAGDINDDGLNDVIVGADKASPNNRTQAGQSYVVFGRSGVWPAVMNLSNLNGSTGFVLNGINAGDLSGRSVASAGDVNGDGISDVIIGADSASSAGQSYIVFGDRSIPLVTNQLTVIQGQFVILNNTYLSANSGRFSSSLVQYSVSNVQFGQFELLNNPGVALSNFTQAQINLGLVRFVQDGGINAPTYSIVAQTGIGFAILPMPQAASIVFYFAPTTTATQPSVSSSTSSTSSISVSSSKINTPSGSSTSASSQSISFSNNAATSQSISSSTSTTNAVASQSISSSTSLMSTLLTSPAPTSSATLSSTPAIVQTNNNSSGSSSVAAIAAGAAVAGVAAVGLGAFLFFRHRQKQKQLIIVQEPTIFPLIDNPLHPSVKKLSGNVFSESVVDSAWPAGYEGQDASWSNQYVTGHPARSKQLRYEDINDPAPMIIQEAWPAGYEGQDVSWSAQYATGIPAQPKQLRYEDVDQNDTKITSFAAPQVPWGRHYDAQERDKAQVQRYEYQDKLAEINRPGFFDGTYNFAIESIGDSDSLYKQSTIKNY